MLPGPVSIAGVQQVFDAGGVCQDDDVEKRVRGVGRTSVCPAVNLERMVRDQDR